MLAFLRGELRQVGPEGVLLEVNGLGFFVRTLPGADWPPVGSEVTVYTHLAVKEDALELYGFKTSEELKMFQILLGVSGMGPKGAQALLAAASPERLGQAIIEEDEGFLNALPGVGPKKAKRLVVELKDKLVKAGLRFDAGSSVPGPGEDEVLAALVGLGYSAAEVRGPLKKAREEMGPGAGTGELLRAVLKDLGSLKGL
ncbi:MAG: Holliday junction branch migration protein RuvA [Thermoanaerobacteraceae bacterium]|uniref:Holliday junction branch migration protein RuvA n=1 Tax=Thermanaeromonas sp. C210 TaxID=2731925 RepID=UPI00155BE97B|nr:Holliday junction branch migration protein RuvA [Thermanaeromonas sp. C210]MBE3581202.1 Holliday junction branch migration protein RuvA [Thermoanaerobacteraceae bacterium]GFN23188.1 Holliday junction ATP-dependent DNA helicase RuvA [Thermanaeromonas sp. C210]